MSTTLVTDALMESFVIEGRTPLSGRVSAAGNKNGALPILAATVLATEPVVLSNVPRIRDVETMLALLADIGADVDWLGPNEVRIDSGNANKTSSTRRSAAGSGRRSCSLVRCSPASAARACRRRAAT